MSTEAPRKGDTTSRTFRDIPGYRFERKIVGFAYARNGQAKPGMQGNGTPRYRWAAYRGTRLIGQGTTLKGCIETARIDMADPS